MTTATQPGRSKPYTTDALDLSASTRTDIFSRTRKSILNSKIDDKNSNSAHTCNTFVRGREILLLCPVEATNDPSMKLSY